MTEVFGAGASGIALFAAFWSWVGFEMAPNYAEETRDPHKIARRRPVLPRVRALRPEQRGRAAQARHLVTAARRARHPRRAGARLDRDHPVLPDDRARRLPLVVHARRPRPRVRRDGRRVRAARRQPLRPGRRRRRRVHRAAALGGSRGSSNPATCPPSAYRTVVAPISITQRDGPSFSVDGHAPPARSPPARCPRTAPSSRPASTGRTTSTSSACGWT
jgi:hypothetical protein